MYLAQDSLSRLNLKLSTEVFTLPPPIHITLVIGWSYLHFFFSWLGVCLLPGMGVLKEMLQLQSKLEKVKQDGTKMV